MIASAYRCKKHNREVGGGEDSAHPRGRALDPKRPRGGRALKRLEDSFLAAGFHGKGSGGGKLHFDDDPKLGPRNWQY